MAYNSYNKAWENEFDGVVSKGDKLQDLKNLQLKLQIHDSYKEVKKNKKNLKLLLTKML